VKYFYFNKFNEKSAKKKERDFATSKMTLEERIIQKNIKALLYEADNIEPVAYSVKNKNSVLEIMKLLEHLMEN